MRILAVFVLFCLLQAIAGQNQKPENHADNPHNSAGDQVQEINSHQHVNKEQHVVGPSIQHVELHVTKPSKASVNEHQVPADSKVSVAIPPKVQQIVTQVSQHIPQVIEQHVANKQRTVRSIKKRRNWREMQVNAVEQPGKCGYICNQLDPIVCGYNGRCYWEFESQCDLSTYNCLNTQQIFHVVDFAKCQDIGAAKCYRGDM